MGSLKYPTADLQLLARDVKSYVASLDELYGHFLDSMVGFERNYRSVVDNQNSVRPQMPGVDLDAAEYIYGYGDPTCPSSIIQHISTQGQYKRRNARGGRNSVWAAQLLLVLFYTFWETGFRSAIAKALGLTDANLLQIPLIGDLRRLRNDIIHFRGVVTKTTAGKLEVLTQFKQGCEIILSDQEIQMIMQNVKVALDELITEAGGTSPRHGTPRTMSGE